MVRERATFCPFGTSRAEKISRITMSVRLRWKYLSYLARFVGKFVRPREVAVYTLRKLTHQKISTVSVAPVGRSSPKPLTRSTMNVTKVHTSGPLPAHCPVAAEPSCNFSTCSTTRNIVTRIPEKYFVRPATCNFPHQKPSPSIVTLITASRPKAM